jgi:hypothetical protein
MEQSNSTDHNTDKAALLALRMANLKPWQRGQSGNPAGRKSRAQRHQETVDELIADLGGNVSPIDRLLIKQAAWLLIRAEDLQRVRSHTTAANEEATRCVNSVVRILLRLRDDRPNPDDAMTLTKYAALANSEKATGA